MHHGFFELQDSNLWMKSEDELNEKWLKDYQDIIPYELFCEAKKNTVEICRRAKGVQLDRSLKLPVLPDADEVLREEILKGVKFRNIPQTKEYRSRIQEEYSFDLQKRICQLFFDSEENDRRSKKKYVTRFWDMAMDHRQ
jgi:hypothetical protein